jgi:photosystem II stability/assembly factor-like uncharacterized protein
MPLNSMIINLSHLIGKIMLLFLLASFLISSCENHGSNAEWFVEPKFGNTAIAALWANDSILVVGTSDSLFLTKNNGKTWQNITGNLPSYVTCITGLTRHDTTYVLVGTPGYGIYRNENFSQTYQQVNSGLDRLYIVSIKAINNLDRIFATASNFNNNTQFFLSTDNGTIWTADSTAPSRGFSKATGEGKNMYFSTTCCGVMFSNNLGVTWQTTWDYVAGKSFVGLDDFWIEDVVSSGQYVFAKSSTNLYYTVDIGKTWTSVGERYTSSPSANIMLMNGSTLILVSDGAYVSNDYGKTWVHIYSGFPKLTITENAALLSSRIYVSTANGLWYNDSILK